MPNSPISGSSLSPPAAFLSKIVLALRLHMPVEGRLRLFQQS
jgi:hypothetical protein